MVPSPLCVKPAVCATRSVIRGDGFGNGFTFANYNAHELYEACWRAKEGYWNKEGWPILVRRAMECDFSWAKSAKSYEGLYNEVVNLW